MGFLPPRRLPLPPLHGAGRCGGPLPPLCPPPPAALARPPPPPAPTGAAPPRPPAAAAALAAPRIRAAAGRARRPVGRAGAAAPSPAVVPPGGFPTPDRLGDVARLLRQAANPTRLLVLQHLRDGERAVGELYGLVARVSEGVFRYQLAWLRAGGLVEGRPAGKFVICRLTRSGRLLAELVPRLVDRRAIPTESRPEVSGAPL